MKNKLVILTLASMPLLGCAGYTAFTAQEPIAVLGNAPVDKPCKEVVLKEGRYFIDLGDRSGIYSVDKGVDICDFNYNDVWVFDDGCDNVVEAVGLDSYYNYYNYSKHTRFNREFLGQEGYTMVFDNLAKKAQGFVCEKYRQETVAESVLRRKKEELKEIVDSLKEIVDSL